ncbi:DUF2179 domain-containing protein [Sedimentibacter sp. zth1]|uniref:DUF2179 domain-containing protein n=1 Tax=Sedimentibacter sp. zth1 TaxID=2816908 RepID=UPI001A9360B0|nr:DUF5698 domain-containing protein [Sedimentibacter sp. zth1]QSX05532.1 DUF2179 domain-containing protein [Sedimentibacter sp. zth1]
MSYIQSLSGPLLYIIIFLAKIVEVTLMTLRVVYINKGEKLIGAIIAFFEVFIWIIVVSSVLNNLAEDPIKILVYCSAFAIGNYLGVIIENKLAVGLSSMQVIVPEDVGFKIATTLRNNHYGVTIIDGKGIDDVKKDILIVMLKRKRIKEAKVIINEELPNALITINDVKNLHGGYIKK